MKTTRFHAVKLACVTMMVLVVLGGTAYGQRKVGTTAAPFLERRHPMASPITPPPTMQTGLRTVSPGLASVTPGLLCAHQCLLE